MKTIEIAESTLDLCVDSAQTDRVVVTRHGQPVAIVVGVSGLDDEQIALGSSAMFWELIRRRREEPTISRDDLERKLAADSGKPSND